MFCQDENHWPAWFWVVTALSTVTLQSYAFVSTPPLCFVLTLCCVIPPLLFPTAEVQAWSDLKDFIAVFTSIAPSIKDMMESDSRNIFHVPSLYENSQRLVRVLVTSLSLKEDDRQLDLTEQMPKRTDLGLLRIETYYLLELVIVLPHEAYTHL